MDATAAGAHVPSHAAPAAPSSFAHAGLYPSPPAPQDAASSIHEEEEDESDSGGPETRRWSSAPVLSSSSAGAALPFSHGARSPTASSAAPAALQPDARSFLAPVSEEERLRRFAERVMEDPFSVPFSSSRAAAKASTVADAGAIRQRIESLPVQDIKWHWEPDDGTCAWIPYDPPLCAKIERHFQLWILATSTSCSLCESRRRHLPFDVATIENSFLHNFRPDVVWRFRFAIGRAGKILHLQVRIRCSAKFSMTAVFPIFT
jgi:hypothetical protein